MTAKENNPEERVTYLDMTKKIETPCISEECYAREMLEIVEPYLQQYQCSGVYNELYYEVFPKENPKGTVVMSYGYTETCEKYHELIYYFHKQGYQVAIIEHRGHGKSVREVEPKCLVHIGDFSQYVEDLHGFITTVVLRMKKDKPLYLYAHSMGGCIGTLYMEEHPEIFEKAVLNAPMLGIQLGMPLWVARLMAKTYVLLGKGKQRVFATREFQADEPDGAWKTNSKARYQFYREIQKSNEDYQTCCCTYSWVGEGIKAGKRALKPANMAKVQIPVLLFQALEDTTVRAPEQNRFIEGITRGRMVRVQACHEIGRAPNATVEPYLAQIFSFLEE